MSKAFRVYLAVMLVLIVLLLGVLDIGLIYSAKHAAPQVTDVKNKVENLNSSINTLNTDLNNINTQLKDNNAALNNVLKPYSS